MAYQNRSAVRVAALIIVLTANWIYPESVAVGQEGIEEPDSSAVVRAVIESWKQRTERYQAIQVEYIQTRILNGSLASAVDGGRGARAVQDAREVRTGNKTSALWDADGHFRMDTFEAASDSYELARSIIIDGTTVTSIFFRRDGASIAPVRFQSNSVMSGPTRSLELLPYRLVLMPLNTASGVAAERDIVLVDAHASLNEIPCLVVGTKEQSGTSQYEQRIWIDPARGYLPLKHCTYNDGRITEITVIDQFEESETHGWIPMQWISMSSFSRTTGRSNLSLKAKVERYVINPIVPASAFTVDHPPGEWLGSNESRYLPFQSVKP